MCIHAPDWEQEDCRLCYEAEAGSSRTDATLRGEPYPRNGDEYDDYIEWVATQVEAHQ